MSKKNKNKNMDDLKPRRSLRVRNSLLMKSLLESSESENDSEKEIDFDADHLDKLQKNDVAGKVIFGFKTRQKRGGMSKKVSEILNDSCSSYSAVSTPQKPSKTIQMPTKTPRAIRYKLRKKLAEMLEDSNSDSDSVTTASDSSSSSESSVKNSDSDGEMVSEKLNKIHIKPQKQPKLRPRLESDKREKKEFTYIMKPDDYFTQSHTKSVTSNNTLQKLQNPMLSEDQLETLLSSHKLNIPPDHELGIKRLLDLSYSYFSNWLCTLGEGFNILLHGLGSKRKVLSKFQHEALTDQPVVVVNGYFPSLTIKDIIDSVVSGVFDHKDGSLSLFEAVSFIERTLADMPDVSLYVIVHNLDGPMLRNNKSQNTLASLAAIPNVRLIASVDHINTSLIWNHSKLSKFNFVWWDVTTFLPYTEETSYENSMLVQKSGALALSSLTNVFHSLTKNSRGVFMLIVNHQLMHKSEKHYQGMPFRVLYTQCRENFLVSSDLALRAQLTEFLDHKLVKSKRSMDGTELLLIPIHNSLLQQFKEQDKN